MLRGSTSLVSAAMTFAPALPNPSRAITWPSVSLAANVFSTPACASASGSASDGGANGILIAGGPGGPGWARTATGSGGGANGILNPGGTGGGGTPLPDPLPASRGEGTGASRGEGT